MATHAAGTVVWTAVLTPVGVAQGTLNQCLITIPLGRRSFGSTAMLRSYPTSHPMVNHDFPMISHDFH